MASANDYAAWIVQNESRKGTPEFATVAAAYEQAKAEEGGAAAATESAARRTIPEELLRQGGLGLRYGVEGLAGIAAPFIDPWQKLAGGKTQSQAVSDLLTRVGVPQPQTGAEEVAGSISRGIAGGGGAAKLAGAIPSALNAGPAMVNNLLAQNPVGQAVAAGIGGGASEVTRQAGGGPTAQLIAGAVTPMVATTGANILGATARGARELVRPVTQRGAEQIAADVVGSVTSDKGTALRNLENYRAAQKASTVGVPGSKPTAGAVSADYGLIGAEQLASRGSSNPEFAKRLATNNQARLDDLAKLRATDEQIAQYVARRDAATAGLREQAFAGAQSGVPGYQVTNMVDLDPVSFRIGELVATPAGGRVESEKALRWLADRLEKYTNEGRIDPRNAYELQKDIADLVAGKVKDSNGGALRLAGGLANDVKKTLTEQIEQAAPGFKRYLETYSRLSKPIERLEVIRDQLGGADLSKVTNATPMATAEGGSFPLSQAKMRRAVGNVEAQLPVSPRGLPLAPYQQDILRRVEGDLNAETLALRGGKMPGSDTYQNMATANLLNRVLGTQLAEAGVPKMVSAPFNFAYRPLESRVNQIVADAFLDPQKMAELLKKSRTQRTSPSLTEFFGPANTFGGLLGASM